MTPMLRTGALVAGAVLTAFHAWLFGSQAVAGQLAQGDAAVRWGVALGLVLGLWVLRRRPTSPATRRRSAALWVLAALLHGPALANDHDGFQTPAVPEVVVAVAQAAASMAALGAALVFLLRHGPWAVAAAAGRLAVPGMGLLPARASARRLRFLPRPPPLA